jgi:hypothetical protein
VLRRGFRRTRYVRRHCQQRAPQRSDQAVNRLDMTFRRRRVPRAEFGPAERPQRRRVPRNVHRLSAKPRGQNRGLLTHPLFPGRRGADQDVRFSNTERHVVHDLYRTFVCHEAQVGQAQPRRPTPPLRWNFWSRARDRRKACALLCALPRTRTVWRARMRSASCGVTASPRELRWAILAAVLRTIVGTTRTKGRVRGSLCRRRTTPEMPETNPGIARASTGAACGITRAANGIIAPAKLSASASPSASAAAWPRCSIIASG